VVRKKTAARLCHIGSRCMYIRQKVGMELRVSVFKPPVFSSLKRPQLAPLPVHFLSAGAVCNSPKLTVRTQYGYGRCTHHQWNNAQLQALPVRYQLENWSRGLEILT
jgi:hypothetical protein